jgi:hypothetical protein
VELEINSREKQILTTALRVFEEYATDSAEAASIYSLRQKIEALKPMDRRIALMDEEGRLFVDGEEMNASELGL